MNIMTSGKYMGETMETVTDFNFLGSKLSAYGDRSHKIKMLAPWKKNCDNLDNMLKGKDINNKGNGIIKVEMK